MQDPQGEDPTPKRVHSQAIAVRAIRKETRLREKRLPKCMIVPNLGFPRILSPIYSQQPPGDTHSELPTYYGLKSPIKI